MPQAFQVLQYTEAGKTPFAAGSGTNWLKRKMALTREYKQTVVARIKRDSAFARALYAEAIDALLEGETSEGLSILRDLVLRCSVPARARAT